ncbi:MAG TPA: DMT family transporter [Chryseosolibacter sp.]|nr:DMT family transporter [Chryseosolibacter sp.]
MSNAFWILLVLIAGSFLPIQAGLNTRLGNATGNAVYAALISFVVGGIALLLYILITRQDGNVAGAKAAPLVDWTGGIIGAVYVTVTILAFPRIGPALTFGLVVAGQMIMSVVLDHTNTLVAQQHAFNLYRLLGIAMIIGGVVLLRKF